MCECELLFITKGGLYLWCLYVNDEIQVILEIISNNSWEEPTARVITRDCYLLFLVLIYMYEERCTWFDDILVKSTPSRWWWFTVWYMYEDVIYMWCIRVCESVFKWFFNKKMIFKPLEQIQEWFFLLSRDYAYSFHLTISRYCSLLKDIVHDFINSEDILSYILLM